MTTKAFIRLQITIFAMIVAFGLALLLDWVTIPTGKEGEWFTKIWELILLVGSLAGLAQAVKSADEQTTKGISNEKGILDNSAVN